MASLVEDRMAVARAAMASTIAARTGMRLASVSQARQDDTFLTRMRRFFTRNPEESQASHTSEDDIFLTLCSSPPAGYHMESELIPIEMIMRDVEGLQTGNGVESREMTTADHFLEEINAFVHNRLLNPALPLNTLTPAITDTTSIDDIYGQALEHATFAGSVQPDSQKYKEANELLFADGQASQALETYRSYETRVRDARAAVYATEEDDTGSRETASQRLQRLETEWIGIGRKQEIEDAFRTVQEESAAAGFMDERSALLDQFRASEVKRFDLPGMTYHKVKIVPISPLLDDTDGFWQHVELDAEAIAKNLSRDARAAFNLTNKQVGNATKQLKVMAFDFVVCELLRDWIDPGFFSARFWRMGSDVQPLSDGAGGGTLPALPTRAIFIRGAMVEYEGERSASPGLLADNASDGAPAFTSTLQVASAARSKDEDTTSQLLEAAKRRGLTTSVDLLRRESERVSANAVRTTVAADVAPTISFARKQPATERSDSSLLAVQANAEPGHRDQSAARATDRQAERVRARRGRVRDHRTTPPTDRRRDHTREPGVRDHRPPWIPITLNVTGVIEATEDQKDELEKISLHSLRPSDGRGGTIRLTRATPTRLTFNRQLMERVREGDSLRYHIILRDGEDNELDLRLIEADDDDDITLNWVVRVERVVIELAGQLTPTLHAYGLRALPPSPNPDESLDWP